MQDDIKRRAEEHAHEPNQLRGQILGETVSVQAGEEGIEAKATKARATHARCHRQPRVSGASK